MDILEIMKARHSVRRYTSQSLSEDTIAALKKEMNLCNQESGLHIQLVINEPKAFDGFMAHYGKFRGVRNYFAVIGRKGPSLSETCGYYGERLVLLAQQLELNTCWVAMTYHKVKTAFVLELREKLCAVIALGYGITQGTAHKSKTIAEVVSEVPGEMPDWFERGVQAALLAPTAMNQQKFSFVLHEDNRISAKAGRGFYTKLDLGIVKYHFDVAASDNGWRWAD